MTLKNATWTWPRRVAAAAGGPTLPTLSSATIPSGGTSISLGFSQAVSIGAGGNGGWTVSLSGGSATLSYASGSGTATLVYNLSRTVNVGETGSVSYLQPGNGVEGTVGGLDLSTLSSFGLTNNSSQGGGGGSAVTTMTLTSAATSATRPFSFGIGFKKGDVPSNFVTDLSNYQVTVKRTWNDGSVKHAIVSGRSALTQNVAKTVNVSTGTPPTGTALTASSIQTAAPTASVQCGANGTVSLASLLASPVRTWVSGPEMVECHYRADVGGGTLLSVWFHVRLWADGTMWVRAICENGYIDNGSGSLASNANRSYVPTVIINGTTVYNNGGASLSHNKNARWSVEGWIGTDPQITPLLNAAYLRSSKLVPNYGFTSPSASALNALTQTYSPMGQGPHTTDMGDTGFQGAIGVLPNWDALFCSSGDSRAFKAVLAGSSAVNSYGMVWRDKTTNLVLKPSAFSNWSTVGSGGGGETSTTAGSLIWEFNHHPSEGYLAYLLTGDYWHYETMALQASLCYLLNGTTGGSGTSRRMLQQTRGAAWGLRTMGQFAAIMPDAELSAGQVGAEYRTLLSNNYDALNTTRTGGGTQVWTGALYIYNQYGSWTGTGSIAPWMLDFMVASTGMISDAEPLATMTNLNAVRDHLYRWPVGRLGISGAWQDADFTRAANYGINVATSDTGTTWYQSWNEIHTATYGDSNTVATNTLQGASASDPANMASGYWGVLLMSIAYAAEHGAAGAADAYNRMVAASGWSSNSSTFNDLPINAITPRTTPVSWTPSYSVPSTVNTSTLIGTNRADDSGVRASTHTASEWEQSMFNSYGGGTFVKRYSTAGAYFKALTGGHNNGGIYDACGFDFTDATWKRVANGNGFSGPSYQGAGFPVGNSNGGPYYEISAATGQLPTPAHQYTQVQALERGNKGNVIFVGRAGACDISNESPTAHKGDMETGVWGRALTGSFAGVGFVGSAAFDPTANRWYVTPYNIGGSSLAYLQNSPTTMTWNTTASFSAPSPPGSGYFSSVVYDSARLLLSIHGGAIMALNLNSIGSGWTSCTFTGTVPDTNGIGWVWHPVNKKFYGRINQSGSSLHVITPPASSPLTNTWTVTTVAIGGSGLPSWAYDGGSNNQNYAGLVYVPILNMLALITSPGQVALIKV